VQATPYRVVVKPGATAEAIVGVRNFREGEQTHRIELHAPPGITVEPRMIEGTVGGESVRAYAVKVSADANAKPGLHLVAFDITRDGVRHGELFDFIVWVGDQPPLPDPKPIESKIAKPAY
jgi:hypothetical protein